MGDVTHAEQVGAALPYLVRRMETFCAVSGHDVLMYKNGRGGIPERTSATEILQAMARN